MNPVQAPFGSWPSTVTAAMLTAPKLSGSQIQTDRDTIWWHEMRPDEDGRTQIARLAPNGSPRDVLPAGFNARTLVHEYGGGAWCVSDDVLIFSNFTDQRLYRLDPSATDPVPVSPIPGKERALRYGDLQLVPAGVWGPGPWVVAVRESHEPEVLQ